MIFTSSIYKIPIIKNVIVYDETDSTNNRAKDFGKNGCVEGTLVVSDCQTAGRGRIGRSFSSPSGEGIYMSLLLKPDIDESLISQITLLSALAISRALINNYGIKTGIKWPNDLLINEKKITGILTEKCEDFIVIGIGINVNNKEFDENIAQIASSLYLETGMEFEREILIEKILAEFNDLYYSFLTEQNLKSIITEYNERLISYDRDIYIIPYEMTGKLNNSYQLKDESLPVYHCMGIAPDGSLICRDSYGKLSRINTGEISVRNAYQHNNPN
ncbi:MAG: biotin--[Lachnospiraceae bacterium]|nr:biotin--[acetyl-CoA-carboxylase] ligase [Lachnospiraceae bacterium]